MVDLDSSSSRLVVEHSPATGLSSRPVGGALSAIFGGLIAVGVIGAMLPIAELPDRLKEVSTYEPASLHRELDAALAANLRYDTIVAMSVLGALAAMTFTLGEGWAARRIGRGIVFGIVALLIGGAMGYTAAVAGWEVRQMVLKRLPPLGVTVLSEVVVFSLIGLGMGVSAALVHLRGAVLATGIAGGLLGGGLAGLLYPIITSIVLPGADTEMLMPDETSSRLAWVIIGCGVIGLTASGLGTRPPKESAAAKESSDVAPPAEENA